MNVFISISPSFSSPFQEEWRDFYDISSPNAISNINKTIHTSNFVGHIHIKNVEYQSISSGEQGGALHFKTTKGGNFVLIEESLFYKCKTNGAVMGGSIYFYDYGYCTFHQICGYYCNTGEYARGQFCYCNTITNTNNYNLTMKSSSIVYCISTQGTDYDMPIDWYYGTHSIIKTNCSNNYVNRYSSIVLEYIQFSYISYCLIENNIAITHSCLLWGYENKKSYIDNSNIINNSQNTDNYGLLLFNAHYIDMGESSIINNRGNNKGQLFHKYAATGSITIFNCYIDSQSFSTPGDYLLNNPIRYFHFVNYLSNQYSIFKDCLYQNSYDYNQYNPYIIHDFLKILKKMSCHCNKNDNFLHLANKYLFIWLLISFSELF